MRHFASSFKQFFIRLIDLKPDNPHSYGSLRLGNISSVVGIILYCSGRYIDAVTHFSDFTLEDAQLLAFYDFLLLVSLFAIILLIRKNRDVLHALLIPITMYTFHLLSALATEDFEFFFIINMGILGICCLYQHFRSSLIFFFLTTISNVLLFVFYFPNIDASITRVAYSSSVNEPSGVIFVDAFIGFIASFVFLNITHVASRKSTEAHRDLTAFDTLLASTPNYMVLVDETKNVMHISEPLAQLAKAGSREVAAGRPLLDLFENSDHKQTFSDIIDSGELFDDTRELIIDGQTKYFRVIASKLKDIENGMFIDLTDVTPVIQSKLEADDARLAAERANRAKSDFLARMSHEIRTPMNAIIGMGDLMRTDNLDHIQVGYFEDIRRSSKTLMQIINDILDFSKIEADRLDIFPVDFNLRMLFDNMGSINAFAAEAKELEYRSEFDVDVPDVVIGDEIRVRQILGNLLNNAVKYTRAGYVGLRIQTAKQFGGDFIGFVIEDSGIGIKMDDMPKLFERFERIDQDKNRDIVGTGLGLSIVKRLAELMGGRIDVQSEYGVGSRFTVYLPLPAGDPAKIAVIQYVPHIVAKHGTSVLVVDDNPINLSVACAFLSTHGIDADVAISGYEAVDKVAKNEYDIVFMDQMMPDINGINATRLIRANESLRLQSLPIIALTANAVAGDREIFIDAGLSDYLPKPIQAEEFNRILQKWLPAERILRYEEHAPQDGDNPLKPIGKSVNTERGLMYSAGNEVMYRQILIDFSRDQRENYSVLLNTIRSGDLMFAHRLAHTFKNTARIIGADALADTAQSVETALADKSTIGVDEMMVNMGFELQKALDEIGELVTVEEYFTRIGGRGDADGGAAGGQDMQMQPLDDESIKRSRDLFTEIAPIIHSHRISALEYVDAINDVFAPFGNFAAVLVRQIENFDYDKAIITLKKIEAMIVEGESSVSGELNTVVEQWSVR